MNLLKKTPSLASSKQYLRNNNFIELQGKEVTKMSSELYYDYTCTVCALEMHLALALALFLRNGVFLG